MRTEAEQIYIIPRSEYPNKIVIAFADCKPTFNMIDLQRKYEKSGLNLRGICFENFQDTILNATKYQLPYRGRVSYFDRVNIIIILGILVLTIALSMGLGMTIHWTISIIFIIMFFVLSYISIRVIKRKTNIFLRQGHFMLAVFCRTENNRLYLGKNIEVRPGFLAKWIEFNIHEIKGDSDYEEIIQKRVDNIKEQAQLMIKQEEFKEKSQLLQNHDIESQQQLPP